MVIGSMRFYCWQDRRGENDNGEAREINKD